MSPSLRLDDAQAIFKDYFEKNGEILSSEPLTSEAVQGISGGLRSLTLSIQGTITAIIGIVLPENNVLSQGLIQYSSRRARARKAKYLVLCNLRETFLTDVIPSDQGKPDLLKQYTPIQTVSIQSEEHFSQFEKLELNNLIERIAKDLLELHQVGYLDLVIPDADFFVERLTRSVNTLKPLVSQALQTELIVDIAFAKELEQWAGPQGIPADLRSPAFADAVVRQAIYRLLGKIIFYQSLRRTAPQLPEINLQNADTSEVMPRLLRCFAEAHKIDYHAVFREDVLDRLPFPSTASNELRDLVDDLNTRDFSHLPQDVIGAVFERLIPPEDRHALGQFFTPEPLVDLIIGFCVKHPDDHVLDPTCGTGTFLIRAYDRLRTQFGVHDHNNLLSQLWGVDIAPFPAELATINLFRQQVGVTGNFPRIVLKDFFEITPGSIQQFPPLKADSSTPSLVDEPIPSFDAIVGNFPYISADRIPISKRNNIIYHRLREEWFDRYPRGFDFRDSKTKKEYQQARENQLQLSAYGQAAIPRIDTFSDLYAYLFWHTAAFLKPGGRMGIVTSNAWLDVGFGQSLQRFFLDNFKIIAILESRCEPWFDQAAVNTVVTILERCEDKSEIDQNAVRFISIKQPLRNLIHWDMHSDGINRWLGIQALVKQVESIDQASDDCLYPYLTEFDWMRCRSIKQDVLRSQIEISGKTAKWGLNLRSPRILFELKKHYPEKLAFLREVAPPAFGSKTGINEFYHLSESDLLTWKIENQFLFPLLKSPSDSSSILIDQNGLKLKVFVCRLSKDQLRANGYSNALKYIEWGERQKFQSGVQAGLTWPNGAEVRQRKPGWYSLPEYRSYPGQIFISMAYGDRYITKYSASPLIADNRLYFLSPVDGIKPELVAAVMNSTITFLLIESIGRVSLGDGALELKVEDARDYLQIPDIRQFTQESCKAILAAFQPLLDRSIGPVIDEIKQRDRQLLDRAVLEAMGLKPEKWLPEIYVGITQLVEARVNIGKMRGLSRRGKKQKAAQTVAEEVIQDIIPNGLRRFPDDFLSQEAIKDTFHEVSLLPEPYHYKGFFFGKVELATESGQQYYAANLHEARYILYAQAAGRTVARLPNKMVEVTRTANNYAAYLRSLRQQLFEAYNRRTLDSNAAERFVQEVWKQYQLPTLEE